MRERSIVVALLSVVAGRYSFTATSAAMWSCLAVVGASLLASYLTPEKEKAKSLKLKKRRRR